jgi:hypothetical protein
MNNIVITLAGGRPVVQRNRYIAEVEKSQADAGRRLIRTTCVRRTQVGRDQMNANQQFRTAGAFHTMMPTVVDLWLSEDARRVVRERLLESNSTALPAFDAGRLLESDLMRTLTDATGGGPDEAHEEPLRKATPDVELFDVVRKTYANAAEDGVISLRKAAAELDKLSENFNKRRR